MEIAHIRRVVLKSSDKCAVIRYVIAHDNAAFFSAAAVQEGRTVKVLFINIDSQLRSLYHSLLQKPGVHFPGRKIKIRPEVITKLKEGSRFLILSRNCINCDISDIGGSVCRNSRHYACRYQHHNRDQYT